MAKDGLKQIISEVKEAGYLSISINSTLDVSHVGQLTIIVRYVNVAGEPVERFLGFDEVLDNSGE